MELETSCLREPVLKFSSIRSTGCKLQQRVIFLPLGEFVRWHVFTEAVMRRVRLKILISP